MSGQKPDVSIVIPNFNCLSFLQRCLDSIRQQSGCSFEIIVIDDGSSDGSLDWLREQSKKDVRLNVFSEAKLGPGGARNLGVQLAKAELIAFLDADDIWYENKLASQVAFHMANPGTVLTFSDYDHIREKDGKKLISCFEYWPLFKKVAARTSEEYANLPQPCARIYSENVIGTSTVVVRKNAIMAVQGFDTSLRSASDWDLWLKLAKIGEVAYSSHRTMGYLMREGSISRDQSRRLEAMMLIMQRHTAAAIAEDALAGKYANARLSRGYQEYHRSEKRPLKALLSAVRSYYYVPTRSQLKSIGADVLACFSL